MTLSPEVLRKEYSRAPGGWGGEGRTEGTMTPSLPQPVGPERAPDLN